LRSLARSLRYTVLDALGIKNGPGHGEVKWFQDAPVLVEVGSRCHGAEGMWIPICNEVVGYNQVSATLDAYTNTDLFLGPTIYHPTPSDRLAYGAAKYLLSHVGGTFKGYNQENIDEIKAMSSFRALELFMTEGKELKPTIDCFTWCGCVLMANKDEAVLNSDYARLEEMCLTAELYEYTPHPGSSDVGAPTPAVVVVDPFSTGAVLAADCYKRGYPVICVYERERSEREEVHLLRPRGGLPQKS
jgi:hypothetical protein